VGWAVAVVAAWLLALGDVVDGLLEQPAATRREATAATASHLGIVFKVTFSWRRGR